MESSFRGLGYGLVFAVLLVYLLDGRELPVVARPVHHPDGAAGRARRASSGCCSSSHTTLSVPALMGSIMCVGVATANSILVVTFANDQRSDGRDARRRGARRRA